MHGSNPQLGQQVQNANVISRPELGSYKGLAQFGQKISIPIPRPPPIFPNPPLAPAIPAEGAEYIVLQTDFLPGPPSAVTVQLVRFDNTNAVNARPVAKFLVRNGGVTYSFRADWSYGQAVTLVCDSFTVSAAIEKAKGGLFPYDFSGANYSLAATLGLGAVSGRAVLSDLTMTIGPHSPAGVAQWPVPVFARSVFFALEGDANGSTNGTGAWDDDTLLFQQGLSEVNAKQLSRVIGTFWPLQGGSSVVQAVAPTNDVTITPIWELAL